MRTVLVAYDGSAASDKAFRYAMAIADKFEATLEVLTVIQPPDFGAAPEVAAMIESGQQHLDKMHQGLREQAQALGRPLKFSVLIGHPAEQIVSHARDCKADLIALGHRGKSALERWLTGSTTKQVMGYAHCPVLIVR